MSRVDGSEDVSLSPVRRILLKIPNTRQEKLCERYLMHGGERSVAEVPGTVRKVLWKRCHARREESCRRGVTHGEKSPVENA